MPYLASYHYKKKGRRYLKML